MRAAVVAAVVAFLVASASAGAAGTFTHTPRQRDRAIAQLHAQVVELRERERVDRCAIRFLAGGVPITVTNGHANWPGACRPR